MPRLIPSFGDTVVFPDGRRGLVHNVVYRPEEDVTASSADVWFEVGRAFPTLSMMLWDTALNAWRVRE